MGTLVGTVVAAIFGIVIAGLPTAGVFRKAGEPGWQGFVPILNTFVLLKIAGRPLWWFLLLLVPVVNVVVLIVLWNDVSKSFGHGPGFTVGLVLLPLIFLYVLWLDGSTYRGPAAAQPAAAPAVA
ncbi:signal peptidase I [Cellulomonas sp. JZ18]|nr:signal peptidase I [Cellulomonas sp. JZ18]